MKDVFIVDLGFIAAFAVVFFLRALFKIPVELEERRVFIPAVLTLCIWNHLPQLFTYRGTLYVLGNHTGHEIWFVTNFLICFFAAFYLVLACEKAWGIYRQVVKWVEGDSQVTE